jgi:hypothetical protein
MMTELMTSPPRVVTRVNEKPCHQGIFRRCPRRTTQARGEFALPGRQRFAFSAARGGKWS